MLAAQCRAITVHMSNALLRSARSGVISSARDFSSVLLLGDARPLAIDEGLPVHAGGAHLGRKALQVGQGKAPVPARCEHYRDLAMVRPTAQGDRVHAEVPRRPAQAQPLPAASSPIAPTGPICASAAGGAASIGPALPNPLPSSKTSAR